MNAPFNETNRMVSLWYDLNLDIIKEDTVLVGCHDVDTDSSHIPGI